MARNSMPGRKDDILNASLLLFAENGYSASSMAAIAKKAKVAVGTLYLYFETKEAILKACAERFHHQHQIEAQRILSQSSLASEKLRSYLLGRYKVWRKETQGAKPGTDLAQAMIQISPQITKQEEKLWLTTLTRIFNQGVKEGHFRFKSRTQELKIFHYNLAAYFPMPGLTQQFKPTEKDLIQMIEWFCQKWSIK